MQVYTISLHAREVQEVLCFISDVCNFSVMIYCVVGKRPLGRSGRSILDWILNKYVLGQFGSLLEGPCDCDIEPPSSLSHIIN